MRSLPGVVNVIEELRDGDPRQAGSHVNGPSLAAVVATYGPMPVHSVLTLAAGLAESLSAAHAAGFVHHDLNPASVLLTADGPRLTGFGGSRPAGRGQATRGGTLDFTSPEQAAVLVAGPASDIFSLGAVLLYAATGNLMTHFAWHLDQLPGELRPLIERCMAADPARRPTATELRAELTAAYPDAVSRAAWPSGGIPAPAPFGTPAPAPFGTPAAAPFGAPAAAPFGTPAGASPFPAGSMTSGAWKMPWRTTARKMMKMPSRTAARKMIRRHAGLIAIAALALAVAVAGTVYVIHPWPYPLLRPAGLTAEQRSANSISIGWSNPASGPLPDKYVILRDGAVAATVRGNVNQFKDGGLAPATTYDFRVIAYRDRAGSQSSNNFYVATRTPTLSEAVFNSYFSVTEKLESGGSSVTGDTDGDTWNDDWMFSSNCLVGPCATQLSGAIDGEPFSAVLKAAGGGNYTGTVPINDYYYCGTSESDHSRSTLKVTVRPSTASAAGTQWQALTFSGSATWEIFANSNGGCGGGTLVMSLVG